MIKKTESLDIVSQGLTRPKKDLWPSSQYRLWILRLYILNYPWYIWRRRSLFIFNFITHVAVVASLKEVFTLPLESGLISLLEVNVLFLIDSDSFNFVVGMWFKIRLLCLFCLSYINNQYECYQSLWIEKFRSI